MSSGKSSTNVKKVEEYKASVIKKAEDIVRNKFPEHILRFNELLEEPPFLCEDLSLVHAPLNIPTPPPAFRIELENGTTEDDVKDTTANQTASKKRKLSASLEDEEDSNQDSKTVANKLDKARNSVYALPLGCVSINKNISGMVDTIKPFIRNLVEEVNALKMWISFLIPKIEDGNNFGVSIQEETLEEIRSVESEASVFYEQIARYFLNRAKLVTKVSKYPHINDYRRAVTELDEKQFLSLRITLCEIRNHYASLHDMINKNLEKIRKPRSSNSHEAMY